MRTILFAVYGLGVALSLLCFNYLEWWLALALVAFLPLAAMHTAEAKGIIHFVKHDPSQVKLRALDRAMIDGLSDEQAVEKYGWQLVNEMEDVIKETETYLIEMRTQRDEFAKLYKREAA